MKVFILAIALLLVIFSVASESNEKKVICYFGSWAVYRNGNGKFEISTIDPHLCTHLIYTFAGLGDDGLIKLLDPWADLSSGLDGFGKVNKLKQANPNLKTLLAMGGWNEGSTKYSKVAQTDASRKKLAQSVLRFVKMYGFDGFDFDWEYPNQRGGVPEDKKNFVLLLKELKEVLSKEGLLLSTAVGASQDSAIASYNIADIAKHVDLINLMTYDYHGASWESVLGIVSPLYASPDEKEYRSLLNVNSSVHYWLHKGAPAEKIMMGVPFYGQTFRLSDRSKTTPGSPSAGTGNAGPYTQQPGNLAYMEICEKFRVEKWNHKFEEHQRVPYSFKDDQWIGYDNVESLTEKAEYIKHMNLGGVMIWSIESDDFKGICGENYPLLKTLNHVLRGGKKPDTSPPIQNVTDDPEENTVTPDIPGDNNHGLCSESGYIRDPVDCTKFYYCEPFQNGFRQHEFHCPAGLYFDTATKTCDYPNNVNCEMRYPR